MLLEGGEMGTIVNKKFNFQKKKREKKEATNYCGGWAGY
jgi:hypothetical protein